MQFAEFDCKDFLVSKVVFTFLVFENNEERDEDNIPKSSNELDSEGIM